VTRLSIDAQATNNPEMRVSPNTDTDHVSIANQLEQMTRVTECLYILTHRMSCRSLVKRANGHAPPHWCRLIVLFNPLMPTVAIRVQLLYIVGSRVIVLLFSFSSTSCSSPTAVRTCSRTLVTCYQQRRHPLEPVRSTRGRCEAYELRAVCTSFYSRDTRSTTS